MGWLFGKKKKVPQVPFPEGIEVEEGSFRLPGKHSMERVIQPERIKAAAGVDKPIPTSQPKKELPPLRLTSPPIPAVKPVVESDELKPVFIKVELYQRILGEIEEIKSSVGELGESNRILQTSEYNEENNFIKLKKSVKSIHDNLLLIDKTIFKGE